MLRTAAPLASALRFVLLACAFLGNLQAQTASRPREVIVKAILSEDSSERTALIRSLVGNPEESIPELLTKWKEGEVYTYQPVDADFHPIGEKTAVLLTGEKDADEKLAAMRLDTGEPLKDAAGNPVRISTDEASSVDTDSDLRIAMKAVTDLFAIAHPDPRKRLLAVSQVGLEQDPSKLEPLLARQKLETDRKVKKAFEESIALIRLKSTEPAEQIAAARQLGNAGAIAAQGALKTLAKQTAETSPEVASAANTALAAIARHLRAVNTYGTIFRGVSTGSVLLVVAIGLAITFGLMGVINMAHGELIAVGAYTTYIVQNVFGKGMVLFIPTIVGNPIRIALPGLNLEGSAYDAYFILAIPFSFLMAALAGILLERGIIQFLYRRPLESLLATWGVSLVLQQLFRSTFGANNVQVDSPAWLSGNWTVHDVMLGWNRVFVIGFAVAIVAGVWLLLTKTQFGLLIRAVTQNRSMAACMGVHTERINMLTFAFGSGLAGLAGAFISQLGNVGPSLGQAYIVDCFMTVVVGGVGNLAGTVISAFGIGIADQSLQQTLGNPVLGKILVLGAIILFLQWRPAGLFATKSRSLEG
jgi:urea transport system permease protein